MLIKVGSALIGFHNKFAKENRKKISSPVSSRIYHTPLLSKTSFSRSVYRFLQLRLYSCKVSVPKKEVRFRHTYTFSRIAVSAKSVFHYGSNRAPPAVVISARFLFQCSPCFGRVPVPATLPFQRSYGSRKVGVPVKLPFQKSRNSSKASIPEKLQFQQSHPYIEAVVPAKLPFKKSCNSSKVSLPEKMLLQ